MRILLPVALVLGLAACAGAPKKSAPPPAPAAQTEPAVATAAGRKQSPYAPAQEDPSKRGDYVAGGLYAPGVRDSVPDEIPDVDAIPEPEVTNEPRSSIGNRKSYSVLGKSYKVLDNADGYVETGVASFYGKKFHGRRTSNLEVYDMYAFSAAHKTLPLPSFARVTNLDNGKSVIVRVNDRGPFHAGRVIDLSYAAATKLGYVHKGTARVEVRALTAGDEKPTYAKAADNPPAAKPASGDKAVRTAMDQLVEAMPIATATTAETPIGAKAAPSSDLRFDMREDGRTMSADEFEAWMKARQVRIATGKPGKPVSRSTTATEVQQPAPVAVAPPPREAAPAIAASAHDGESVILQIASFTARANADRALALLRGAGIEAARLFDGDANGQKVWRLRVGPLAAAAAPELAARIVGLGFGRPQRVRE
jgi:rare lipoprotein A